MARVKFSVQEGSSAAGSYGPAESAAESGAQRADAFWWDSAWELHRGVDVTELAEIPAEYLCVLGPTAAR